MSTVNRLRICESVRNWDSVVKIGTLVEFEGKMVEVESHAGGTYNWSAAVCFIEGVEEPVELDRLKIPGYDWGPKRRKR